MSKKFEGKIAIVPLGRRGDPVEIAEAVSFSRFRWPATSPVQSFVSMGASPKFEDRDIVSTA
jgi:hypothetical protein